MAEKTDDQRPARKRSAGKTIPRQELVSDEATQPTTNTVGREGTPPTPPPAPRRTGAGAAASRRQPSPTATVRSGATAPAGGERPRRPRPVPSAAEPAATSATPATPAGSQGEPSTDALDEVPDEIDLVVESDVLFVVETPSAEQSPDEQPDDVDVVLVSEPADDTEDALDADLLNAADALLDAEALAEASALAEVAANADAQTLEAILAAEAELAAEEELSETIAELAAVGVQVEASQQVASGDTRRTRFQHNNALGMLIERTFEMPSSPCHSYSDLERRSRVSREAISRYVTPRPDRRRSPSIDSLVAIADAMHLSIEVVCRAAAASAKGVVPQADALVQTREDVLRTYIAHLSDEQFSAIVELLVQMRPLGAEK